MKLLFINPWTKSLFGDEKQANSHPHIGLAYLVAVCKKNGYQDIRVFDQGIEKNDDSLFTMISSFKPALIGITTFSYCYKYAKELIDNIKSSYPNLTIIAGGAHISATKEHILLNSKADFAMKGESEISFIAFLKEIETPKPDYSRIDNLIWRDGTRIVENRNGSFIDDLDSIPFPDYEACGLEKYLCYKQHLLPLITSRGCPYNCNYCAIRISMGRNFRARRPENVVAEINHLYDHFGIRRFEINDDCFAFDVNRAKKICDLIIDSAMNIKYEIYNGIRADNVSEELLKKMKKSGCVFICYGCEAGNQKVLRSIGKNLDLKKVTEAVNLTNKVGISNSVNFIIGHPGETYETAMDSIRFARSLKTNFVNFYNLIPYPGTELFNWISVHATYKMPFEDYLQNIGSRDMVPVFETKEFSREEKIKVLKKGYVLYKKSILRFRLGKVLGSIAYYLSLNDSIFKIGRTFIFDGGIGSWLYRFLTKKSRVMETR